jgi:glycosyltransferase involved in cell wall biosynthesis
VRSLHVITTDARRGAETFAVQLVAALQELGSDAAIAAMGSSGSRDAYSVPVLGTNRRSPVFVSALRRAAKRVDVVVAHGSSTLEACAIAMTGTSVPFVYRNIGDPSYWVQAGWRGHAVGVMMRQATRVAALWPEAALRIHQRHDIPLDRIDVIANAVDETRYSRASQRERTLARRALGLPAGPCLAFVGALSPEKDPATAIRALSRLPGASLLVAGDGPELAALRRVADSIAPARVRFLGQVVDPVEVYRAADLLLLPSLTEGMPAVILEAGLVGTPTVSSAVGAVPTMVHDGETGFLAPPGRPSAFADRVAAALPSAAEVGDRAAAEFRGNYSIEAVAKAWVQTLERATIR